MNVYTIEFEGSVPEFGSTIISANDLDEAKLLAKEYVDDTYPEMSDVVFTRIQEDV